MASEREVEQVRKDPGRWRSLLQQLLQRGDDVAPRHLVILDSLHLKRRWLEELSFSQADWLLDIRDDIVIVTQYRNLSIRYLLNCCYQNHLGLDEDDEEWVLNLHNERRVSLRKDEARHLYALLNN